MSAGRVFSEPESGSRNILPTNLAPITAFLDQNEKAFGLDEVIMTPITVAERGFRPTDFIGRHRYQVIGVERNDQLAIHYYDMGLAENFDYGGLRIAALWEHTVAELQDMAEQIRSDGSWEREIIAERQGKINFGEALDRQDSLLRDNLANRSVFGQSVNVIRNGRTWKGAANVN